MPQASWLDDNTYLLRRPGAAWQKVNALSGDTTPLYDAAALENALAALSGVTRAEAASAARAPLEFNATYTSVVVTLGGDLYFYDFASRRTARLTSQPGDEEEVSFSPNGQAVAFVRNYNLYAVDVASARERALTADGGPQLFNGKLDWLYQEEIYGRGNFRGYWWSPDSSRLAFLQLDERPVPEYTVTDHLPYRPALEVTDYPKAGDPNPLVRVGIVPAAGGAVVWADAAAYAGMETLVVEVSWTPDSRHVEHQVQNREQTWLEMNLADAATGRTRTLLRETTKAWVNNNGGPVWLKDGSFLWFSERTGFKHLYRYRDSGAGPGGTGRRRHVGTVGRPPLPRRGRGAGSRLFLIARAERAGPAGVPHRPRRGEPHAAVEERRQPPGHVQPGVHTLRRPLERSRPRRRSCACTPPTARRCG